MLEGFVQFLKFLNKNPLSLLFKQRASSTENTIYANGLREKKFIFKNILFWTK